MRVLLVGTYPLESHPIESGIQSAFASLVQGLGDQPGLEVQVISLVPGLAAATRGESAGVPIDYLPVPPRLSYLTRHARERRVLRREFRERRPDLIHAQDALGSGFACLKAAFAAPVVVTIHGIMREEVRQLPSGATRIRARLLASSVERYCVRNADFLLAPTDYPATYFAKEIRGRFTEVANPVAEEFFALAPSPERGRVLYAGSLINRKRLLDLVEAMKHVVQRVPEARLRVAGDGVDTEYGHRVRERVSTLDLDANVEFLGALRRNQLLEEYRRAAVLVLPSSQETSPMSIAEAMAARVPVVATNVGGVTRLVDDGVTGYVVEVGQVRELAGRVTSLLVDAETAAAFAGAGRRRALDSYGARSVASRVRAVYEEAIEAYAGQGYASPA